MMNQKVSASYKQNNQRENAPPAVADQPQQLLRVTQRERVRQTLTPREKVLKTLRLFRIVYDELDRDKNREELATTMSITYSTRKILLREGKGVNSEKRIGAVPGIEVGDVFQYKTELDLVGLHFEMMGGIDSININGRPYATSIVASEGNNYGNIFKDQELIYSGVGENQTTLVRGNLALANSMSHKRPVRVIRGKKNLDQRERGKRYVYLGLYLVQGYWKEKGLQGKSVFKFRLRRLDET